MRRLLSLIAFSTILFTAAATAQNPPYVISNADDGAFSVTRNNNPVPGATNVAIGAALDAIRENTSGLAVTIRFGAGDNDTLELGGNTMFFTNNDDVRPPWGEITLTGTLNMTGRVYISAGLAVTSTAVIEALGTSAGTVDIINSEFTMAGGSIITSGRAISASNSSVTISGGTVSSEVDHNWVAAISVHNNSTLTITNGTFSTTNGVVADIGNQTAVEITGGKFDATGDSGRVLTLSGNNILATISGTPVLTSALASTINYDWGSVKLVLKGGEVTNKSEGGRAINAVSANGTLVLGGSPKVTGTIATRFSGQISIETPFTPGSNRYALEPLGNARSNNAIAVTGGAAHINAFTFNIPPYSLAAGSGNLIITLPAAFVMPRYVITGSGINFTVTKGSDTLAAEVSINTAMDSIRINASVLPCTIQFGSGGTDVLDLGTSSIELNGSSGDGWGRITFTGRVTSAAQHRGGLTYSLGSITAECAGCEMEATGMQALGLHSANFTLNGGTIKSLTDYSGTIYNGENSTLIINSGTVSATVGPDYTSSTIENTGILIINGGTITNTEATAISNRGEAIISGNATVTSADTSTSQWSGGTLFNSGSNANLTITGGTISNTAAGLGGVAIANSAATLILNDSSKIFISDSATVTSGGTAKATILNYSGTVNISGGTMTNTAGTDDGVVINNSGEMSTMSISGGTVSTTSGTAVVNTGTMGISGGTVTTPAVTAIRNSNESGKLTVSGTAVITSKNALGFLGTIHIAAGGHVHILGGKIENAAEADGVAILVTTGQGGNGHLTLGGSPEIIGTINAGINATNDSTTIRVLATGESVFAPGSKLYVLRILTPSTGTGPISDATLGEGNVIVANAARFTENFAFSVSSDASRLAASGNNIVSTKEAIYWVTFNLNGGVGAVPVRIGVMEDARLGEHVLPPADYVNAEGYKSDGKWYIRDDQEFLVGRDGIRITGPTVLTLKWTDEQVSVASTDRVIPDNTGETALITPVKAVKGVFTAGPNPVAKQAGRVNFFWSGVGVTGGQLLVYNASGNLVKRIALNGNSDSRNVASWDLTDSKGRLVADGTYLVRGIVFTNTGKHKVAVTVGVW